MRKKGGPEFECLWDERELGRTDPEPELTNNLQFLDSLLIETLLFGDDSLSEE